MQAKHWPKRRTGRPETATTPTSIDELREAAKGCRRCPLWRDATQTVFGEGPDDARRRLRRRAAGRPGGSRRASLSSARPARCSTRSSKTPAIDRQKVYVTNAVKHFKFEPRGKRRIHSKPNAGEVQACRWWLDHELALLKPDLVVALGATAALSLLGKAIAVTKMRGQVIEREDGLRVFLTIHPVLHPAHPRPGRQGGASAARFLGRT